MLPDWFHYSLIVWIAVAVITFFYLFRTIAPFGRHTELGKGPLISNRAGWMIMESPAVWLMAVFYFCIPATPSVAMNVIFLLWMIHYVHRTLIFPFRTRTQGKKMPLMIVGSAFFFQLVNGFFNGYTLQVTASGYDDAWLTDPRFIAGVILFFSGMAMNQWADAKLIALRKPGETGYKIPRGGFFEWVSCPNFLGEVVEWGGFALLCWNLAALSFFLWTVANLLPRGWAHHKWYQTTFADYPKGRKAVIPGLF